METALLIVVLAAAACFAFLNGFRDASAAIALPLRTRALTPTLAVLLAAFFNFVGALMSLILALSLHDKLFAIPSGVDGLAILAAGVAAAVLWGIYQWWRGYPSSSTHALIGGLVGAGFGAVLKGEAPISDVNGSILPVVVAPLLLSPVVAMVFGYLFVYPAVWGSRYSQPSSVHRKVRQAQAVGAGAVALGHGMQDGQRTIAIVVMALEAAGLNNDGGVPVWVVICSAALLALGTLGGGWRIVYTLGTRLVRLDPMRGFVAQMTSGVLLFVGAMALHLPLSTTHTTTSATIGAGMNQPNARVNRRLWLKILRAWVATPVVSAAVALILYLALSPLI